MKKPKNLKNLFKFKKSVTTLFAIILSIHSNSAFCDILVDDGQKLYNNGDLASAESYYLKKLETVKDDWRLHFNLGNTLYKQDKFDESIQKFEDALKLCKQANKQANIFYNIGNSRYKSAEKLPETNQDEIKSKIAAMEPCLNDYKSALDLDKDAKDIDHNLRFVEKRLDDLKKKLQEEQQKSQNDQNDDKDKQDNKDQNDKSSDKNDDNNSENKDNQQNSKNNQDQQNSENNKDDQNKENNKDHQNSENKQDQQNSKNSQDDQKNSNQNNQQTPKNQENKENNKKPANTQEKPSEADNKKDEMESLLKSASGDERILPMMQAGDNNIPKNSPLKDW